jgi:transcriptional regulator with XRE-family HTH domain
MNNRDRAFLRTIGDRIRDRRTALGLTQAELGERCQLHRTFVGSVERGERNVSVLTLRALAAGLRVKVIDLFQADAATG